jgi:hypothetical protein
MGIEPFMKGTYRRHNTNLDAFNQRVAGSSPARLKSLITNASGRRMEVAYASFVDDASTHRWR